MTTDPAGATPASANFEKLKAKLRELFELDKADLDFGIYRVLRARHTEITEFLDRHLEKTVREALQAHSSLQQTQLQDDLRKAEQAARDAGYDADQAPRVLEIRERIRAGGDLDALADEVYSHLYTFFSRYYQEGDFLGLHRATIKGREKYMLPYNGEEVKLVWANQDQYYIKSSELLRDYAFQVTPGAGTLLEGTAADRVTVHFKLVEADTEKDNRKPNGKVTRAFALDDEAPFFADDANTLSIRFRYREHPSERNLQDKLNADTERTLADHLPPAWKAVLFAPDPTHQAKSGRDTRTILQKHLRAYTARHQFDYFIHKDLGGFLGRELDFYLKNEVMHLDDIEAATAPKAEEYLSKLRAIRRCAQPVIRMLAQLENFQKKLWLKKKFVVETRYCVTLDRVPAALYPEIAASDAQRQEWVQLYAIQEIAADGDQPGYSEPLTVEFLHANRYMMVDTRHFGREFTRRLLASIEDLDESLDGVCFHSENFQALQLMQERYREQVRCVYIDPPYNSKTTEIAYKNSYKHSSWLALIANRVVEGFKVLRKEDGVFVVAIDENETDRLALELDHIAGGRYARTAVSIVHNPRGIQGKGFSYTHEFAHFIHPEGMELPKKRLEAEKSKPLMKTGSESERGSAKNCFYPIFVKENQIVGLGDVPSDDFHPSKTAVVRSDGVAEVWPISSEGMERKWRYKAESLREVMDQLSIRPGRDGCPVVYLGKDEESYRTVWTDAKYNAAEHGSTLIKKLIPNSPFSFPKSLFTVSDCLEIGLGGSRGLTLDFFAGSGTTGHAVMNMNRQDSGGRKYLLAEMGEYFETVLVHRLKKAA